MRRLVIGGLFVFGLVSGPLSDEAASATRHEPGTPVIRTCHGKWSYSHHKVTASVVSRGPASVKFTAKDSGGKSVSGKTTIAMGRSTASKSMPLAGTPTLVMANVVERNADGSLRGVDETCDLSRARR